MEYIILLGKNKLHVSHLILKRRVFYIEVCNNKLFDCHHSDKDRIYFIHECKKWMQTSKAKNSY